MPGKFLVRDSGGKIEEICFFIADNYLRQPDEVFLNFISNLIGKLENLKKVIFLVSLEQEQQAKKWFSDKFEESLPNLSIEMAPLPQGEKVESWARDHLVVGNPEAEPRFVKRAKQAEYLAALEPLFGGYRKTTPFLYLDGGDYLVGKDHWFIGAETFEESGRFDRVRDALEEVDGRTIIPVRHDCPDDGITDKFKTCVRRCSAKRERRNPDPSVPLISPAVDWTMSRLEALSMLVMNFTKETILESIDEHIDRVVSLAEFQKNGQERQVVLIADLQASFDDKGNARKLCKENLRRQKLFCRAAQLLEELGIEVKRNATAAIKDKALSYNNVVIDGECVIVPSFADAYPGQPGQSCSVATFDQRNCQVWKDLGYRVKPIEVPKDLVSSRGGPHCITKEFRRR